MTTFFGLPQGDPEYKIPIIDQKCVKTNKIIIKFEKKYVNFEKKKLN